MKLKSICDYQVDPDCTHCEGEGWVCENHNDIPWMDGTGCPCGGAGEPCRCNTLWSAVT